MGSISSPRSFLQVMMEAPRIKGKVFKPSQRDEQLINVTKSLILNNNATPNGDPFYVLDLGVVATLMDHWVQSLPEFRPFYAVKCNPQPEFLAAMAAMGSNFDCATRAEIESVLALGVSPDRIVFANPCKLESHIEYAASVGVNLTTFDSEAEIQKLRKRHPKCRLLLRIKSPEDGGALRELSTKYGALPEEVAPLLAAARAASLLVVGVAFHVGSAATNTGAYAAAVAAAKTVFDVAAQLEMPAMRVLDIGGGFFAGGDAFEEAAAAINAAVREHFGGVEKLRLMAEPGRFFAETAFRVAARVVGKRVRGGVREYWINDGIHGSFMGIVVLRVRMYNLTCMAFAVHSACDDETTSLVEYESTVFGPTCDSHDVVLNCYRLPELEVDDWLVFPDMGAYSSVFKSNFNGFNTSPFPTYLVASESGDK